MRCQIQANLRLGGTPEPTCAVKYKLNCAWAQVCCKIQVTRRLSRTPEPIYAVTYKLNSIMSFSILTPWFPTPLTLCGSTLTLFIPTLAVVWPTLTFPVSIFSPCSFPILWCEGLAAACVRRRGGEADVL